MMYHSSAMMHVTLSVVGQVIFSHFFNMILWMQKTVLSFVNIEGQYTCMHFKRA